MLTSRNKPPAEVGSRLHLLSLPYDVRYLIYSHLFPSLRQLYLMASRESIHPMMRPGSLSMDIFLTCRQLRLEASGYLYNNYLFNIIGYKKYCMAQYRPINLLVERYAKHGSSIEILDNGLLSSTACVSIHAKGGRVEAVLQVRQRGKTRNLEEVEKEAAELPDITDARPENLARLYGRRMSGFVVYVLDGGMCSTAVAVTVSSVLLVAIAIWIARLCN
jgi:hypothetical protein